MRVRAAAVAGTFYPREPQRLRAAVEGYLAAVPPDGPPPEALIVPHAGYVYSGAVAGSAYARLRAAADTIRRVVLLGPAHRDRFPDLATSGAESFVTPLGEVRVDATLRARALATGHVVVRERAHLFEHAIEVQLPFLQVVLRDFAILPLVAGGADPQDVADVLQAVRGGPETLLVVSTDLSHYHDLPTARRMDAATADAIERLDLKSIGPDDACGCVALRGLLALARRTGMEVERLDLRTSADTAGDPIHVVGYGAWALARPVPA